MILFRRSFWGLILIFWGVAILLEKFFNFDFPLWSVFWSLVIIIMGISILFPDHRDKHCCGRNWRQNQRPGDVIMGEGTVGADDELQSEYNIVFGHGLIDLTKVVIKDKSLHTKINTVFSDSAIKISSKTPVRILSTSAFGVADLPGGRNAAFGETDYKSKSFVSDKPYLFVRLNVVFANTKIVEE